MSFRLSEEAQSDAISIFETSVLLFGEEQARKYHSGLYQAFAFLADFPHAARERTEIDPPVRVFRYKSHLIVYTVEDRGVLVVRIPHGHEDWQNP